MTDSAAGSSLAQSTGLKPKDVKGDVHSRSMSADLGNNMQEKTLQTEAIKSEEGTVEKKPYRGHFEYKHETFKLRDPAEWTHERGWRMRKVSIERNWVVRTYRRWVPDSTAVHGETETAEPPTHEDGPDYDDWFFFQMRMQLKDSNQKELSDSMCKGAVRNQCKTGFEDRQSIHL